MANPKLAPGEHILVNVTATMRAMLFPTLELLLITGLGWMIIGYFDRIPTYDELGVQTGLTLSVQGRNMLVVAWMVLGFLRFVLPLVRACRSRLVVTTSRVLLRAPGLTTSLDTIPLVGIYNASRRGNHLIVNTHGFGPILIRNMPRTKKIAQTINDAIAVAHHNAAGQVDGGYGGSGGPAGGPQYPNRYQPLR
jgi:hypothetical membrane protein